MSRKIPVSVWICYKCREKYGDEDPPCIMTKKPSIYNDSCVEDKSDAYHKYMLVDSNRKRW